MFRAPPLDWIREVWLVLPPRRRWFVELVAGRDDLLRLPIAVFPNVTASSSGVPHWWRIASVAMLKGHRSVAAAKSRPDRSMSHRTLCIGSSAGCRAKCLPKRWLKSASDSIASSKLEIASNFFGANSFRMWRGATRANMRLNSSTVAFLFRGM